MNKLKLMLAFTILPAISSIAQVADSTALQNRIADSIYIEETERKSPLKILHAEPLYIDLIRDLGARKGEKEWNIGMGLTDNTSFDSYNALVEYEFAPLNRLGLEVELPFQFYFRNNTGTSEDSVPKNRLNGLKLAAQYSFLVSDRLNTTLAVGYIHEFEFVDFHAYGKKSLVRGNVFNPFFVAAKRWGENFHTLLYSGPVISSHREQRHTHLEWQINTNLHYMIPGTRNFLGIEFNKQLQKNDFDMTIRPQLRVGVADNLLVGIVTGIPVKRENQRFSTFIRVIYEPQHKKH